LSSKVINKPTKLTEHPEEIGPALAHVVTTEGDVDVVLGQAWIAGPNKLITCGHVVDQYVHDPGLLEIKFPASGNRYQVRGLRLHPSFVRQPDQLVKYDAAVLYVELGYPEREVNPLPILYEKPVPLQTALSTIRYPVHLGQLTSAPTPLAQMGRMLGALRKHDNFHLLHDLALAPGDSGAPLFDGTTVIAMHCGDTATLPGLNLPTTSIRLALWVDALRDLGITETQVVQKGTSLAQYSQAIMAFALAFVVALGISMWVVYSGKPKDVEVEQPKILPIEVSFNKPPQSYAFGDVVKINIVPTSSCYIYLFYVDDKQQVYKMFPPYGYGHEAFVNKGEVRTIDRMASEIIRASYASGEKLHLLALNSPNDPLKGQDYAPKTAENDPLYGSRLNMKVDDLEKLIKSLAETDKNILHVVMDAPAATGAPASAQN
jgi:hypothetical protein